MKKLTSALLLAGFLLGGCATHKPMDTVEYLDLERFMGGWYVIASIPTFIERNAFNAVESYSMDQAGRILTRFTFREGGFDGELKEFNPVGFVTDEQTNATWGMQFVWPIKADYRVVYLDDQYSLTVIGREARDYVWIMARQPGIDPYRYRELTRLIDELGYDTAELRQVPQRWEAPAS